MPLIRPMMGEIIDLTDPQYLAMIRKAQPSTNFHMENSALALAANRIGVDSFEDEALLIQLPRPLAANQILGFEFDASGWECFHDTNPPFSTGGSSHHLDVRFVSSDVDVSAHAWNDYLSYAFTRTITFLMSHVAPGSSAADFTTSYGVVSDGIKPGFSGLQATTSNLQETLVKGIVIVGLLSCGDEHNATLDYDDPFSAMKIYRGLI